MNHNQPIFWQTHFICPLFQKTWCNFLLCFLLSEQCILWKVNSTTSRITSNFHFCQPFQDVTFNKWISCFPSHNQKLHSFTIFGVWGLGYIPWFNFSQTCVHPKITWTALIIYLWPRCTRPNTAESLEERPSIHFVPVPLNWKWLFYMTWLWHVSKVFPFILFLAK